MEAATQTYVEESVDHLFRHHAGQMVSVLSRIFGLDKLDLVEDAVQDALVTALRKWPFTGMPDNPPAWLTQVAKNRVLDDLRRTKKFQSDAGDIELSEDIPNESNGADRTYFADEVSDDQLRMIFACCHPLIPADSQVALTLKVLSGFGITEIAHAFLAKDDAIAKMIVRAKQKLRKNSIQLEMPPPAEISARLDPVLKVLYLMFNEGYAASEGEELIRRDLCFEAIRLAEFLSRHPVTNSPKVHALTALFLFQAARLPSRSDVHGELLLLSEQDRSLWDQRLLARAVEHFRLSASGDELTDYHLEAEIAAYYALADDFESTKWPRILKCYETLQARIFSPIVELNRIIVLAKIKGSEAAIDQLNKLQENQSLNGYNLFHITKAHFLADTGAGSEAVRSYQTALGLTHNKTVHRFLEKRIDALRRNEISH